MLQVLEPTLDPTFSNSSYGFRPRRSAHNALSTLAPMALEQARKYVAQEGRKFVVDLDLEKFFDRVNHDILMSRVARRIGDKRLLLIVRRFLRAGLMQDGLCVPRDEGTPQGGPLTPRYWLICCLTTSSSYWRAGDIASAAMPTTAISMCDRWRRGSA